MDPAADISSMIEFLAIIPVTSQWCQIPDEGILQGLVKAKDSNTATCLHRYLIDLHNIVIKLLLTLWLW